MSSGKSYFEVILMPLAVAVVGIAGSLIISNHQDQNAEQLANAQIEAARQAAEADRQIAIIDIFSDKISGNAEDKVFALKILGALDSGLHEKLAAAVADSIDDEELSGLAQAAVVEARDRCGLTDYLAARRALKTQCHLPAGLSDSVTYGVTIINEYGGDGPRVLVERGPMSNLLSCEIENIMSEFTYEVGTHQCDLTFAARR